MKRTRKGRLARRALSLLFALMLLWECGALTPKARAADVVAADGTVNFVLWQDVSVSNVQGNLEKYCSGDLRPILMSYRDGGEEYFVCATKDNWRWQSKDYNLVGMPKVSDHRFDEMRDEWRTADGYGETFITIGTFNSLWGRYQKDGGYSGLVLAVSDGNDGPGEFLGPGKHYAGQTYGGNKVRDTSFVVRPEETKPFRVTYDDLKFRMWNYDKDGDNEDVVFDGGTIKLSDSSREHIQAIMAGTVINASALTHDFTVLNDQATTMGRPVSYIPEGVTLRVASGGVLAVDGILLNDGKIVVEPGGLLVLRELSMLLPYRCKKTACGGISSAGTIVVEKNGKLIGGGANGVYLTGGVVYNYSLIASENFTATKKQLINNQRNAWVVAGRSFGSWYENMLLKYALRYMLSGYSDDGLKAEIQRLTGKYCKNCSLPFGRVSIADGAVYGDTSRFKNYGSFGEAGGMMKVFYHDDSSAYEVLSAPRGTLGYQQSDTSHTVTRREVVYASGQIDTLRTQYEQMQNMKQTLPGKTNKEASLTVDTELTFEQYIEQYFRSQGIDLDEKVTVRDGVITTGGLPELTIPWNQRFSVVRESAKAAEQTPGFSTLDLYFVQRKCPAELGATVPLGG